MLNILGQEVLEHARIAASSDEVVVFGTLPVEASEAEIETLLAST